MAFQLIVLLGVVRGLELIVLLGVVRGLKLIVLLGVVRGLRLIVLLGVVRDTEESSFSARASYILNNSFPYGIPTYLQTKDFANGKDSAKILSIIMDSGQSGTAPSQNT